MSGGVPMMQDQRPYDAAGLLALMKFEAYIPFMEPSVVMCVLYGLYDIKPEDIEYWEVARQSFIISVVMRIDEAISRQN